MMDKTKRLVRVWVRCFALLAVWGTAEPTSGAIIGTDAAVSVTVQELIDGVPASVTSDSKELDPDSGELPLVASGDLLSTDLDGALVSMGQAFSEFSDPIRLDQPNPEEFALEVASYSNGDSVSYSVTGSAEEARTVVFTTSGSSLAPPEIDFGTASTRTVESRVFLSGAVIFWSNEPGRQLGEMLSEFSMTVTRDDTGATLFETTLNVTGENAGRVRSTATGPIRFETVDLEDLRNEGVDEETISILDRLERDGTLIVVVIPPQEHPYTYTVTANEPLVLRAVLNARVRNLPGGTGVAAAFGTPFENLADFIEHGMPGVNGIALQRSVNAVSASRAIGLVTPINASASRPAGRLCGAFGFESAAILGLLLFVVPSRRKC